MTFPAGMRVYTDFALLFLRNPVLMIESENTAACIDESGRYGYIN